MAFSEFACDPVSGDNMNGGGPIGGGYPFTYVNGAWNSVTGVFTVASGNPQSDGIAADNFAAVFIDGSTTPGFVGVVTGRSTTTITISVTFKIGTVPTTAASGMTCKVGGAWKGPNGANTWPIGNVNSFLVNAARNLPRINLKNNATYAISAALTQNQAVVVQGYATNFGDGGKATIDGSTNAINLFTFSGSGYIADVIFANNGTTGTNYGLSISAVGAGAIRCVAHDIRGHGIFLNAANTWAAECEAYLCNKSNTASFGGMATSVTNGGGTFIRCNSHSQTRCKTCHEDYQSRSE